MAPIPNASFYDDAESDGNSDELIIVNDEDDINDEEEEFAMPIDDMFIVNLMGLNIAPGAIPRMLGNDGANVIANNNNSGSATEKDMKAHSGCLISLQQVLGVSSLFHTL